MKLHVRAPKQPAVAGHLKVVVPHVVCSAFCFVKTKTHLVPIEKQVGVQNSILHLTFMSWLNFIVPAPNLPFCQDMISCGNTL